ncbi:MAG TPA: Hpt domain-containing protein [Methylomirabilota bacterium]|nr:Hpt domain-containing protein [Methylomirabilota bacterium]
MTDPQDREFLLSIFLMEAWDTLATLEDGLGRLREPREMTAAGLEPLSVVSHRLKGAAALHGFPGLSELAGAMEQILERLPAAPPAARAQAADFLSDLVGVLKTVFDGIGVSGREDAEEIAAFGARHPAFFTRSSPWETSPVAALEPATLADDAAGGLQGELDRFFAENAEVLAYFGPEAAEHLEAMTKSLLTLEQAGPSEAELATLFRAVHTLKGAAYTVGCTAVGDLAHQIEDLLVAVREERVPLGAEAIEAVFAGVDTMRLLLALGEARPADLEAVLARTVEGLSQLMPAPASPAHAAPLIGLPESEPVLGAATPIEALPRLEPVAVDRRSPPASTGIRVNLDRLDALMNLVGELVIARSRLDRRLTQLDRVGELLLFSRTRMAKAVRDFEARHQASPAPLRPLDGAGAPAPSLPAAGAESIAQLFAELEFDRYSDFDILARSVAELSADLSEVQNELAGLIRSIWEDTAQIQRLTGGLRTEITRARMVPVGKLFARFARQVREAAKAAGKAVVLEVSGESVEVDSTVIEQIADPLLHLVRNAIAHGIEPEEERRARGKPARGTIYLSAYHRGGFIYVEVEDDGRGIDTDLLRREAVRQGHLRADAAPLLSEPEALNLMFLPGFSTAATVTTASGRGVGMDVVRTNVSRLNGEIDVETESGAGTRFTLKLPLTVVISDALLVRSGAETLAIPLSAVRVILIVRPGEIQAVGHAEMVRVDDQLVDLIRMDRVLALPAADPRARVPVVVLRAGGKSVAVAVDELLGKEEIVIKSLGGFLEGLGPFAGATISGEGRVILLVEPARLIELAGGGTRPTPWTRDLGEESQSPRPRHLADTVRRVLLVDDSVSVRKFVGHMLERAGFRVITANDGAEALHHLTESSVHAVITDLEMPRVNGYELIEDLRRRPSTRNVPVVVLTTRAGEKHLTLARRLGVQHYVSKPVDEHAFVRLIASLTTTPAEAELSGAPR